MSSIGAAQGRRWTMPIVPESYDRSPLTAHEKDLLATTARQRTGARRRGNLVGINGIQYARDELLRFQKPIYDVMALRTHDQGKYRNIRRLLYREMVQRDASFWQWSRADWIDILCPTYQDYVRKYGPTGGRQSLMDIAYFLGGVTDLREAAQHREAIETAKYIFGAGLIEQELKRITDVLMGPTGRGYSAGRTPVMVLRQALALLFLLNRSPYLEDLSPALLQIADQGPHPLSASHLSRVKIGLQHLGLIEQLPESEKKFCEEDIETAGVPEIWVQWDRAWLKRQPKVTPRLRSYYSLILSVGRWLAETHPQCVSPEQWDEALALEYVRYICTEAKTGDYASANGLKRLSWTGNVGKPLAPRTMNHKLAAMRCFFGDLQRKPHTVNGAPPHKIEERFNPHETFATPSSVHKLIQPDPRDIDEVIWCKLTYAAATLTERDYDVVSSRYPLGYYRAAALLWVTSARRPNEITRLQVGCVRRDWDPAMLDDQGLPVPGQEAQLCYLHIPSNKTKGPYWVPIPKYTADAIEWWEKERPTNQPKLVDSKDNSLVNFLFCMRGKRMGHN